MKVYTTELNQRELLENPLHIVIETKEEAKAMYALTNIIGGCPNNSLRKLFGMIRNKLGDEIGHVGTGEYIENPMSSGVIFKDFKGE